MNSSKPIPLWTRPFIITFVFALLFKNFWNHIPIIGDTFQDFGTYKFLIADAISKWKIYAWYPWQRMGMPFIGFIITGYFYPLNFIYFIFSYPIAQRLFIFLHYPLAAIFMDLFLRKRGLDRNSSLLGALAFSLSGYMVGLHRNMIYQIGPAWAPLALYFMDRALSESASWGLAVGAVLAIQIFAGEPQSAAVTALLVVSIGLIAAFKPSRRRIALGGIGIAGISGVLFSAAQWMPAYELLTLTNRSVGLSFNECAVFSFHPGLLIELVWPNPFCRMWPEYFYWAGFTYSNLTAQSSWSASNYVSLCVLVLAAVGVFFSRRPWKIWVGIGMIFFLLPAFGRYTPIYELLYRTVPFFKAFRYPAKYMAWFTGFTAVAAALGMEHLLSLLEKKSKKLIKAAIIYMGCILVGAILAVYVWPKVLNYVTGLDPTEKNFQTIESHLFNTGIQWLIINMAIGAILLLISAKIIPTRIGLITFFIVLMADFYLTNISAIPVGRPDIYNFQPLASKILRSNEKPPLGNYRIYRWGTSFTGVSPDLTSSYFWEQSAIWERSTLYNNLHSMEGFEDMFGYNTINFNDDSYVFGNEQTLQQRFELFNLKYMILSPYGYGAENFPGVAAELVYSDQKADFSIIRFPDAWPRSYWVPTAKAASDLNETVNLMDSSDLKKTVILTTDDKIAALDPGDRQMKPTAIRSYEPDHVVVFSDSDSAGWLVLSDRYYFGWNAYVDGRQSKIYKANVLVRAIPLEPGKHTVDFVYRPVPLRIGVAISSVSFLAFGIFLAIRFRNRASAIGP